MQPSIRSSRSSQPTFFALITFQLKVWGLQLLRAIANWGDRSIRAYPTTPAVEWGTTIAESRSPIWGTNVVGLATGSIDSEQPLIAGKIHNLRVAIHQLNGVEIPAGSIFSFWAQVGQPTRFRGYVKGRELRQGCIVPTIAGGLCQLANALYQVAVDADLEIVERHRHSTIVPGSAAETDRDATIFWNYVDLRFRSTQPVRIEAELSNDTLIVRLRSIQTESVPDRSLLAPPVNLAFNEQKASCQSCQAPDCIRKLSISPITKKFGTTAYLVDEYWAEFDRYIQHHRTSEDLLLLPLDGKLWRRPNYSWTQTGFGKVDRATLATLWRSIASRNLPVQGSSRQQILLTQDAKLAAQFSKSLTYDVTHLVVMQNLLPYLWASGALGGRTFDVLMTRLPIDNLQSQLTAVHLLYPESPTLGDFRADLQLLELERQALQAARQIITPHRQIARLFPDRSILLDWQLPAIATAPIQGHKILFPSATLGRKGAYELRTIARELDLELTVANPCLEGQDFWHGVQIETRDRVSLDDIGLVILPAHVEHKPRILLRAIACGIPVIATDACGLGEMPGLTIVPVGNLDALRSAIARSTNVVLTS
jgi:glycosyltransferase involved in cell wall biosynthesis